MGIVINWSTGYNGSASSVDDRVADMPLLADGVHDVVASHVNTLADIAIALQSRQASLISTVALHTAQISALMVSTDHGNLTGLLDDDHPQYLLADGTRVLSGNLSVAPGATIDGRDVSADGTSLDAHLSNTSNPHGTSIANIGAGTLAQLNAAISDADVVPTTRQITAGAGLSGGGTLEANRTFNIGANADGSIVVNADDIQVGVLATDAQHGVRGGGTLHDVATTTVAGFMSAADKLKLDGLTPGVTDHGALSGLSDDDHTQYLLVDGSRAMSGQLQVVDGLVATPGILFASGVGLSAGSGGLSVSHSGVERWRFMGSEFVGITNGSGIRGSLVNGYINIKGLSTTGAQAGVIVSNNYTFSGSSGIQKIAAVTGNFSDQTGTAGWTALTLDATDTGAGSGEKRFLDAQLGGVSQFSVMSDGRVQISNGSAAAPSLSFLGDSNTGVYRIAEDTLGFATGGVERWRISATGILYANGTTSQVRQFVANTPLNLCGNITNATHAAAVDIINSGAFTGTGPNSQRHLRIVSTINQTSSASGFSALQVNVTNTALGSGPQYLLDLQVGGTTVAAITNETVAGDGLAGRLLVSSGTQTDPSIGFVGSNTGFFLSSGTLGIATGGTQRLAISSAAVESSVPVLVANGSAATPGLAFASDADTGLYRISENALGIATGGTGRWKFSGDTIAHISTTTTATIQRESAGQIELRGVPGSSHNNVRIYGSLFGASSGVQHGVQVVAEDVNQSGSAGFTGVGIYVMPNSTGSGPRSFLYGEWNYDPKFRIDHNGTFYASKGGTTPHYTFLDDPTTGIEHMPYGGHNRLGARADGAIVAMFTATSGAPQILVPGWGLYGLAPSYSFDEAPDTGMYFDDDKGGLAFANESTPVAVVTGNGILSYEDLTHSLGTELTRWKEVHAGQTVVRTPAAGATENASTTITAAVSVTSNSTFTAATIPSPGVDSATRVRITGVAVNTTATSSMYVRCEYLIRRSGAMLTLSSVTPEQIQEATALSEKWDGFVIISNGTDILVQASKSSGSTTVRWQFTIEYQSVLTTG